MPKKPATQENHAPAIVCTAPWRLTKVTPLENYKLEVEFMDGTHGVVEMEKYIMSPHAGIFAKLKDLKVFNQVYLAYGVVTWPEEIDLAPDTMYDAIRHHGTYILT